MKRSILKVVFLTVFAVSIFSCKPKEEVKVERPNIVWITSEDNSKHYMSLFDENGVETPSIKSMADQGVVFNHAFSNAPVCSVARSTIISGSYTPRIGANYHRKIKMVPMPKNIEMFPAYLKSAGYYTTNNSKEDYNLVKSDSVWDESSKKASWRNRKEGQPFFHVFNIGDTHESRVHFTQEDFENKPTKTDVNSFKVQENHPNTDLFKYTNAVYRDKIQIMDKKVGEVLKELEKDGLLENTIIFYYGDHGGVLPGSKGYIYETGLHIPMVVRVPEKYKHLVSAKIGSRVDGFVSFIDLAPTVLNLAGVEVPKNMDGKAFLGKNISSEDLNSRDETYSYADRFDEKYDMVRAVRKGKYKYMRSYQPFNFDGLMNNYRYKQLAYKQWADLHNKGKLNAIQDFFFNQRPAELLFDVEADPFETKNLATNPEFKEKLLELRGKLNNWVKGMPDLSFYPEFFLINNAFNNPVKFGQEHKQDIVKYINIANLSLEEFKTVKAKLENSLKSADAWERYWALITCSSFKNKAKELVPIIRKISLDDTELINKVRAAEYLGLIKAKNPVEVMTNALYASKDGTESLLILNSIVLMSQGEGNYNFNIKKDKLNPKVLENSQVLRRLEYLEK